MTVRHWRLAVFLVLGLVGYVLIAPTPFICAQSREPQPKEAAPPANSRTIPPGSSLPSSVGVAPNQQGLPIELVIDPATLDTEQSALESLHLYLINTRPAEGFFARVSRWVSRLFAGGPNYRATTVGALAAPGQPVTNQDVAVEGLFRIPNKGTEVLVAGESEIQLDRLPHTQVLGFDSNTPDGLPVRVEGNANQREQGTVITVHRMTPAPVLTLVRLARCHELRSTKGDLAQAVMLYDEIARQSTITPWSGFAMAHGGVLAAEILRDEKKAADLYFRAWELEGRAKRTMPNNLPVTWIESDTGWKEQSLREAVGQPLDTIKAKGFWYRFVDFFVTVSGGNAGIGLIVMAIVTRLLLYPLTKKQLQSAKAMQRLQPQIKALQEKHGTDKQKFQEEFWKLCRRNNVNPLGGCWPLLVQMPLLIMVYRGIRAYIVQLDTHHFIWINSLADPDMPLLILYTISMIVFQKLTMKTQPMADPQQQQQQNMMVWMMPIMFFMFFQGLPSGFILYWLGTNLIYLPQQYFGTRVKTENTSAEEAKAKTVTLEPTKLDNEDSTSANGGDRKLTPRILGRLRELTRGSKLAEGDGKKDGVPSYDQKERQAKPRARRRPTRRRKRRS
ncbi:MAG: YidC/Oxa1 family membrane protein insertase [Candidatus Zipacnadales bacterium]